jgi:hypothetical protein
MRDPWSVELDNEISDNWHRVSIWHNCTIGISVEGTIGIVTPQILLAACARYSL